MKTHHLTTPITSDDIKKLSIGDKVLISGTIYTARDAAHKRLYESITNNKILPLSLYNQIIYYCGPTPAKPSHPIGSAGPTTSGRMDKFTSVLLNQGIIGMIGKGDRSESIINEIKNHGAIYLTAVGGAGAFYAKSIISSECIAYPDLGAEAIYKLEVLDFVCYVSIK